MTTIDATTDRRPEAVPEPRASTALSARRWFLIVSPVLAGVFAVIGAAADPAAGISDDALFRIYAANPDPL